MTDGIRTGPARVGPHVDRLPDGDAARLQPPRQPDDAEPAHPAPSAAPPPGSGVRFLGVPVVVLEIVVVVGLAVGLSAVRSVLSFIEVALAPAPLSTHAATLNGSAAPGHPWIDLGYQLTRVVALLLPAVLVVVLALRGGEPLPTFGITTFRWRREMLIGLGAAAAVGGIGLAGYLISFALGGSLTVVPTSLPPVWWRVPVLVLSAAANAILEEVVLCGYLLRRLDQLGMGRNPAALLSATVRGSYHLYQGLAGALGNLAMGLVFARYRQRTGRITALVVAHTAIDTVAFLGYLALAGHVSWLPS